MTDQDQGAGAAKPPAALLELPPDAAAVRAARRFVTAHLEAGGLDGLTADAELAVSELTANVVLHARTPMLVSVETTPTTARIGVRDGDPRPPVATAALSPALRVMTGTTVSGRGLGLVAAVAVEWGILPRPPGKEIWFLLGPGLPVTAPASVDPGELLDAWAALDAAAAADETVAAVIDDLPVQEMLAAKARMEDLVRDLRLALLHHEQGGEEPVAPADEEEVAVARMLDDAVTEFADGRSQLRRQVVEAASHGRRRVDLVVRLRPDQGGAARRYREALDAADELGRRGKLLLAGSLVEHADLRRTYLDEIIRQLEA